MKKKKKSSHETISTIFQMGANKGPILPHSVDSLIESEEERIAIYSLHQKNKIKNNAKNINN